jgi:hypothetical protein
VPVAQACNPSYSGRLHLEASLGKQFVRPYLKKERKKKKTNTHHTHKKRLLEWLKV